MARSVAPTDQELRLAERTLRRIDDDLRDLRESGASDAQVIADYTVYRDSVRAMVETQRRVAAAAQAGPSVAWEDRYDPPRQRREDALADADRELDESLWAFDEYLSQQQAHAVNWAERMEEESQQEMTDLAQEAAAAVERLRKKGINVDTNAPPEAAEGKEGQEGLDPPEGDQGDVGQQGDAGEQDAQGEEGAQGQQGAQGRQGTQRQEGSQGGAAGSGQEGQQGAGDAPGGDAAGSGAGGGAGGAADQREGGGGNEGAEGDAGGAGSGAGGTDDGAQGASDEGAAGGGGGQGGAAGESSEGGAGAPGSEGTGSGADNTGGGAAGGAGASEGSGTAGSGRGADEESDDAPPVDRPPADDDDIVARQLREAAERETDPELKKKLWGEYDRYKGKA